MDGLCSRFALFFFLNFLSKHSKKWNSIHVNNGRIKDWYIKFVTNSKVLDFSYCIIVNIIVFTLKILIDYSAWNWIQDWFERVTIFIFCFNLLKRTAVVWFGDVAFLSHFWLKSTYVVWTEERITDNLVSPHKTTLQTNIFSLIFSGCFFFT